MLDTVTKRRIDTARDILVGKIPDPKSQVEQITIALIYKFMDDMDGEAEELGGKRSFFAGDFARYGWAKLMRSGLGGHEMLNLYAEAIARMPENPGVPPLFRDIFKNAFLPYRDPETLRAFLKVIDEFEYDHSERLGDAFEYLLSVLGSQGDAGQFRTPRHIIDFIVDIVDPKKDETILDPACGTAGFLISAWKHIQDANRDANGDSTLTPDEQERLASNIKGYDISPDMVRLSLANMYLHGFTDPHIVEYDTLTSDERWNEFADVILANPPFMSPKGGIRPHNRFSVPSNRSEVLFVDYIAEHLTPNGRAGIIVPEGVIFQSGKAYKALRKALVENYLVAVISLPAGVFNPYSGVKTSILILDRPAAKVSKTIGFFKVANDGFTLGAQRREVGGSELPQVISELAAYRTSGEDAWEGLKGRAVAKATIGSTGDFSLNAERYRDNKRYAGDWPMVRLGDVAEYVNGFAFKPVDWHGEGRPIIRIQNLTGTSDEINRTRRVDVPAKYLVRAGDLLISWSATIGFYLWTGEDAYLNQHIFRVKTKPQIEKAYLFYLGQRISREILRDVHGNTMQHITKGRFEDIEIPLPPLEVQRAIVAEIDAYQRVINGARAVTENYRPLIAIDPAWRVESLKNVTVFQEGPGILAKDFRDRGVPLIRLAGLRRGRVSLTGCNFLDPQMVKTKWDHFRLIPGDLVVTTSASFGNVATVDDEAAGAVFYTGLIRFAPKEQLLDRGYLKAFLGSANFLDQAESMATGSVIKHFGPTHLRQMTIPLPPLQTQQEIVAEFAAERALVEANRELIARMEKKIEAAISRVWGAAEPFLSETALAAE